MFGRCFSDLQTTVFQTELATKSYCLVVGIFAIVFLEDALVVATCIQVEYAGVAQEKFERCPKLGEIRVFSA